jgi:formate C-acetyltransferase
VDEWFFVQEIRMEESEAMSAEGKDVASAAGRSELLCRMASRIPISILPGSSVAGSQDCAFSPSYALINPSFKVERFAGYCDPCAIYADVTPDDGNGLTPERIAKVRAWVEQSSFVNRLGEIYRQTGGETKEVVYFIEPVTGHTIPDLRPLIRDGVRTAQARARSGGNAYGEAMAGALAAALILGERYRKLAENMAGTAEDSAEKARLFRIARLLKRVPAQGAYNLHEAIQSFVLLWQVMALEQAPNPYAFSVGNLDRILQPYFREQEISRDESVELVRHLLTFFQVGSRCWAISQNVIVGGRDAQGNDLTCDMTGVVLDAFFASNDPQPALSVKVHANTPEGIFRSLGRFFFTPGHSTPSLFNDDTMMENLRQQGIAEEDLADYAIAGCQEPLVMGKSSLNTTNSWLNLAKILELTLNDGTSLISGVKIGPSWRELGYDEGITQVYGSLEDAFLRTLDYFLPRMRDSGNACTQLLGEEFPVPFASALMDSFHTMRDMRDPKEPGTRYAGSGCLIHGLSVVADSIHAVKCALKEGVCNAADIRAALQSDFRGYDELRTFLHNQDKFGNNKEGPDAEAVHIAEVVSDRVRSLRNPAGRPFLADWSTPSTHLLYGYWVGATPDGRAARASLGYGLDPRPEAVRAELPERFLSAWKLPYLKMTGGYASHLGLRAGGSARSGSHDDSGSWMRDRVIRPLFRLGEGISQSPYYVYLNVDSPENIRKVMADPKRYAPSGIYIMRIHGTFVNFLDLSPDIQQDIIRRLDARLL